MRRHFLVASVCLYILFSIPGHGMCSTLDPGTIGARSLGMHGVAIAIPGDLLSAFFHNPAGLCVMKGTNFQAGAFYILAAHV